MNFVKYDKPNSRNLFSLNYADKIIIALIFISKSFFIKLLIWCGSSIFSYFCMVIESDFFTMMTMIMEKIEKARKTFFQMKF